MYVFPVFPSDKNPGSYPGHKNIFIATNCRVQKLCKSNCIHKKENVYKKVIKTDYLLT